MSLEGAGRHGADCALQSASRSLRPARAAPRVPARARAPRPA